MNVRFSLHKHKKNMLCRYLFLFMMHLYYKDKKN